MDHLAEVDMSKQSTLPPDWATHFGKWIEDHASAKRTTKPPAFPGVRVITVGEKELTETAEAIWRDFHRNGESLDRLFHVLYKLVDLLPRFFTSGSSVYVPPTRTRAENLDIVRILEIIKDDWFEPLKDRDFLDYVDMIIDNYRQAAEKSSNSRKQTLAEKKILYTLMYYCREQNIRCWAEAVSPLMSTVFGPTWNARYVSKRACKWKLNKLLSERDVTKSDQDITSDYWRKRNAFLRKRDNEMRRVMLEEEMKVLQAAYAETEDKVQRRHLDKRIMHIRDGLRLIDKDLRLKDRMKENKAELRMPAPKVPYSD